MCIGQLERVGIGRVIEVGMLVMRGIVLLLILGGS